MPDYSEETLNNPKRFGLAACAKCGEQVRYDRLAIEKDECSFCGSNFLNITMTVKDTVPRPKDCLKAKANDDSFPSKSKVRVDLITGFEKSCSNGKWVEKTRLH